MILSMKLNNYRKCRLWVNEIGELSYTKKARTIEKIIPSLDTMTKKIVRLAFELLLPKNNSNYALIGFEFEPNDSKTTMITLTVCNEQLPYNKETLAMPNDKVFIGVSEEYGQSIFDSFVEALNEVGGFPSGKITINLGAYAECGSSKAMFARTIRILLKLAKFDLLNMTEEEIRNEIELML